MQEWDFQEPVLMNENVTGNVARLEFDIFYTYNKKNWNAEQLFCCEQGEQKRRKQEQWCENNRKQKIN